MAVRKKTIIGLTGGIGSGKTTIARMLQSKGFPVFYADEVAKKAYTDADVKKRVVHLLGEQSYDDWGQINKTHIADKVFNDRVLLEQLNAIIHPYVAKEFDQWLALQSSALVFKEAAILLETGGEKLLDGVLVVVADKEERIARVMQRDNVSREQVEARMSNQWSDEQRMAKANFVIENNSIENASKQVDQCLLAIKEQFNLQSFS
jgi:dephospho-CoA kinase